MSKRIVFEYNERVPLALHHHAEKVLGRTLKKTYNLTTASLIIFPGHGQIRKSVIRLLENPWFEFCLMILIIVNCIILAVDDYVDDKSALRGFNAFLFTVFMIETILRVLASGLLAHPLAHFRSAYNIIDFVVVILSLLSTTGTTTNLTALRSFRGLQILRAGVRVQWVKTLTQVFVDCVPLLREVFAVWAWLIIVAAIGTQLSWSGTFHDAKNRILADYKYMNFDNSFYAGVFFFKVSTLDSWLSDIFAVREYHNVYVIFFLFFAIAFGVGVMFSNMFLALLFKQMNTVVFRGNDIKGLPLSCIMTQTMLIIPRTMSLLRPGQCVVRISETCKVETNVDDPDEHLDMSRTFMIVKRPVPPANRPPPGGGGIRKVLPPPESAPKENKRAKVYAWIQRMLKANIPVLRPIVKSLGFQVVSFLLTLLNVIALSCDYRGIDDSSDRAISIINLVCTILLFVEVAITLAGLGMGKYFRFRLNIMDFVLSVLYLTDLAYGNGSPLGALRALRLVRFLRYANNWKQMHVLTSTISHSVLGSLYVTLLLCLICFVFTLLGTTLFADSPDFENFPIAFFSVVACATGHGWGEISRNVMNIHGPASILFFLALLLIVRFVILNMLLSLLMAKFRAATEFLQAEKSDIVRVQQERIAQSPKPSAPSPREPAFKPIVHFDEQQTHNPIDDLELKYQAPVDSLRTCTPSPSLSEDFVDGIEEYAVAEEDPPTAQPQNHHEYETILHHMYPSIPALVNEYVHETNRAEQLHALPSNSLKPLSQVDLETVKQIRYMAKIVFLSSEAGQNMKPQFRTFGRSDEERNMFSEITDAYEQKLLKGETFLYGYTCYFFSSVSDFRKICTRIARWPYLDALTIFVVLISIVLLFFETNDSSSTVLDVLNVLITFIFVTEVLIKCVAQGVWKEQGEGTKDDPLSRGYFRDPSNCIDAALTFLAIFALYWKSLLFARGMRVTRILNKAETMKNIIRGTLKAVPHLLNMVLLHILLFWVFAVMGVALMKDQPFICSDRSVAVQKNCTGTFRAQRFDRFGDNYTVNVTRTWDREFKDFSFDNVGEALFTLFRLRWQDMIVREMLLSADFGDTKYLAAYFMSFALISMYLQRLLVALLVHTFSVTFARATKQSELTETQRRWILVQRELLDAPMLPEPPPPTLPPRMYALSWTDSAAHRYFNLVGCIIFVIMLLIQYEGMSDSYSQGTLAVMIVLTMCDILDYGFRLFAQQPRAFYASEWNRSETICLTLQIIGLLHPSVRFCLVAKVVILMGSIVHSNPEHTRRLSLVLHVVRVSGMTNLNIFSLCFLLSMVYGTLGVQLFGDEEAQDKDFHFRTLYNAMMLLLVCATSTDWATLIVDFYSKRQKVTTFLYFTSYLVLCRSIFMTLFTYSIVNAFLMLEECLATEGARGTFDKIRNAWRSADKKLSRKLHCKDILNMMAHVPSMLRGYNRLKIMLLKERSLFVAELRAYQQLHLPVTPSREIWYDDFIASLALRAVDTSLAEGMHASRICSKQIGMCVRWQENNFLLEHYMAAEYIAKWWLSQRVLRRIRGLESKLEQHQAHALLHEEERKFTNWLIERNRNGFVAGSTNRAPSTRAPREVSGQDLLEYYDL
eukprot:PhF_6_TR25525/c0_g1_i1/m.35713